MTATSSQPSAADIARHAPTSTPRVSVIMSTYNRGELLGGAIRSVLSQDESMTPPFELLVVDNNSTDGTREAVERFVRIDRRVRYVFEPQQGLSYARNRGIHEARAPLLAFTDDDVRVATDWVRSIVRAFHDHSEASIVGGRVLPIWPAPPPAWLTRDHWAPLALMDHGDGPVEVTRENPICLIGANLSVRREIFDLIGLFATDFQRVKDGIGSLEDHDFQLRLLRAGHQGMYDPRVIVHAEVQPNRLQRAYHRRWHTGHGHFYALLRLEDVEQTDFGTLFGVPAHMYRQALLDAAGWLRTKVTGTPERAFQHEAGLRFFRGFFRTRRREFLQKPRRERRDELWRLLRRRPPRPAMTSSTGHGVSQGQG